MNNLQHIVKNDTRAAMHMAVELCEQGDFDSVAAAFKWLMQEREAADTIESLRDRLQESYGQVPEQGEREDEGERESYSRWHQLFGTPERAARMWIDCCNIIRYADCPICHDEIGKTCEIPGDCVWVDEEHGYDALLEWLRGDAE